MFFQCLSILICKPISTREDIYVSTVISWVYLYSGRVDGQYTLYLFYVCVTLHPKPRELDWNCVGFVAVDSCNFLSGLWWIHFLTTMVGDHHHDFVIITRAHLIFYLIFTTSMTLHAWDKYSPVSLMWFFSSCEWAYLSIVIQYLPKAVKICIVIS